MTTPTRPLLLAALLCACYANKADSTDGPTSGTGLVLPDGGGTDGALADAAPADAPDAGHPSDLAADRPPPSPAVTAYQQYLEEQWKAWSARWVACFNSAPEALSAGSSPLADDSPDQHAFSLTRGLVALDEAGAKACLEALRTLPCEALATESYREVCGRALVGKVAPGGFCGSSEDCQGGGQACGMATNLACSSRCQPAPRAAIGEPCGDRACAPGAFCAMATPPAADSRCQAVVAEGAACPDRTACQAGTFCQPAAADGAAGTCRRVQAGVACQGSWQCPIAYACLIPAGAAAGICQPGLKKGEACTFHGKDVAGGPYHDCANGLYCYPDAGNRNACGVGHELGESCEDLDVGGATPVSVPCRVGSCQGAPGKHTCALDRKLGEACAADVPCAADLVCLMGKCADPVVPVGEHCTSEGTARCPEGARCVFSAPTAGLGTCVLIKKVGEACGGPDECEEGAACNHDLCMKCL